MRVLITGIAGFIGSHLAEALLAEGHSVAGIDNLTTGRADNVPAGAAFTVGDIRFPRDFPVGEWDVVYHCAASYKDRADWESDASVNVGGTINVIREARGSRIVYFQTSLCYGPHPVSPVDVDAPLNPVGSYAVSKTAGEAYIRDSGTPYVSLRLANMYGPRNLSGPVPTFYQRVKAAEPCTVVQSRRDFVYVGDLIEVAVQAATVGSGPYNIASGTDRSIEELFQHLVIAAGVPGAKRTVIPRGHDDVATLLLDPTRTAATYRDGHNRPWATSTPLQEGIEQAIAWYEQHPVTETYTHLAGVK